MSQVQLDQSDNKELWYLRDMISSPQFKHMTENTRNGALEAIQQLWKLIEIKYKVNILKIQVVTREGLIVW